MESDSYSSTTKIMTENYYQITCNSSTPVLHNSSSKFKSISLKQANHTKLKNQSSPYNLNYHHNQNSSVYENSSFLSNISPAITVIDTHEIERTEWTSSSSLNESSEDYSYPRTNPPSTPVISLTPKSDSNVHESIHYVTPVTNSLSPSTASSVSSRSKQTDDEYATSASTTEPQSSYTRSSSMTSLSSFDIKSVHSSIPSEYSTSGGYLTPSAYSDIPDSPGEHHYISQARAAYAEQQLKFMKNEDYSVLTVDSNPKSNDITLIERTVLAAGKSGSNSCSNSAGRVNTRQFINHSAGRTSESNNLYNQFSEDDENQNIISYNSEESLNDDKSRNNVSNLTFSHDETTPDLEYLKGFLEKRTNKDNLSSTVLMPPPAHPPITVPAFTPPVKLVNSSKQMLNKSANRSLINSYDDNIEIDQSKNYSELLFEDENDDKYSNYSIPSLIKEDRQRTPIINRSNFGALLNKVSSQKQSNYYDSPSATNNSLNNSYIAQFNQNPNILEYSESESEEEPSPNNSHNNDEVDLLSYLSGLMPTMGAPTNSPNYGQDSVEEDDYEEGEPSRVSLNNEEDSDLDLSELLEQCKQHPQLIFPQKTDMTENIQSRLLPKIEEEEEDESEDQNKKILKDINHSIILNKKFNSLSKQSSTSSLCSRSTTKSSSAGHNSVVVQMTKTARLRLIKNKAVADHAASEISASLAKRPIPSKIKENLNNQSKLSSVKKPSTSVACSSVQKIKSTEKTSSIKHK